MHRLNCAFLILVLLVSQAGWAAGGPSHRPTTVVRDRPIVTPSGVTLTLPKFWSMHRAGPLLVLQPPETDTRIAVVDAVTGPGVLDAAASAWSLYRQSPLRRVTLATPRAANNGWDQQVRLDYENSPSEHVDVFAIAYRHGARWTVLIHDGPQATVEKREAAVNLIIQSLRPPGFRRESFAGRRALSLSAERIASLISFVQTSMQTLGVPGAALAFIDHGKVVFEGGLGLRELGKPPPVDAHTLFMIASNTKALTTLLIAKLVDQGKISWDEPVIRVFPSFRLGNEAITQQVLMRHLVCACTGMPRQDLEWILNTRPDTPASSTFSQLAATAPTSGFGEVFQYNNLMPAAAGYIAAHILYPDRELGAAYDTAMQEQIFKPLGMAETTLDMGRALAGNHANPHGDDIDGRPRAVSNAINTGIEPYRPTGGIWSSAHDLIKYVQLELAQGVLPDGTRFVSAYNLLLRRAPNVSVGEDRSYGLGLIADKSWGVPVIHHSGALEGFQSDFLIVPDAAVGAVLLTNADDGEYLLRPLMRRLLEVLYDGRPEAAGDVSAAASRNQAEITAARGGLEFPVPAPIAATLASHYMNPELGEITVRREAEDLIFDFGTWNTRVASHHSDDGSTSFITLDPKYDALEFVVAERSGAPALMLSDGQHEYVYVQAAPR